MAFLNASSKFGDDPKTQHNIVKPAVEVTDLCCWRQGYTAISMLNFSVNKGQLVGLLGPNGAGKSTLLRCLAGLEKFQGQVLLNGLCVSKLQPKEMARSVAVVSQQIEPVFDLSLLQVVRMGLIPHKKPFQLDSQKDEKNIQQALKRVSLFDKKQQRFSTLSGGEQQRCLIARALVQNTPFLFLDEPTNHLDVYHQHQVLALIKGLGLTVIIAIHDLNLAAEYCDQLLLLQQGQLLASGIAEDVLQENILKEAFHLSCQVTESQVNGKKLPNVRFFYPHNVNDR